MSCIPYPNMRREVKLVETETMDVSFDWIVEKLKEEFNMQHEAGWKVNPIVEVQMDEDCCCDPLFLGIRFEREKVSDK